MTTRKRTTELADRLAEIAGGVTAADLAAILRRTEEEAQSWIDGAEPDSEAKILLRPFMDPERPHAAALAVERVRKMHTLSLKGGSGDAASVTPPYGTGDTDKKSGGVPQ